MSNNRFEITVEQRLELIDRHRMFVKALEKVEEIKAMKSKMTTSGGKAAVAEEADTYAQSKFEELRSMMKRTPDGKYDLEDPYTRIVALFQEPRSRRSGFYSLCLKTVKDDIVSFLDREAEHRDRKA